MSVNVLDLHQKELHSYVITQRTRRNLCVERCMKQQKGEKTVNKSIFRLSGRDEQSTTAFIREAW